jgi:hypothetical protein
VEERDRGGRDDFIALNGSSSVQEEDTNPNLAVKIF